MPCGAALADARPSAGRGSCDDRCRLDPLQTDTAAAGPIGGGQRAGDRNDVLPLCDRIVVARGQVGSTAPGPSSANIVVEMATQLHAPFAICAILALGCGAGIEANSDGAWMEASSMRSAVARVPRAPLPWVLHVRTTRGRSGSSRAATATTSSRVAAGPSTATLTAGSSTPSAPLRPPRVRLRHGSGAPTATRRASCAAGRAVRSATAWSARWGSTRAGDASRPRQAVRPWRRTRGTLAK